ncbi:uncharacterized protein K441DRAFT_99691 [Cenococcum geophilum 1.58]|uniref:uncharacterized protein n=1 Tax=Cenococcum geophilum 1.58 TaxID=794803 RepID=UPI00358F7262|nr:hypothetical protein K441DRAFT_99691 [Cenococcum geophilum 1.58]
MTRENELIVVRAFLFPFEPVGVASAQPHLGPSSLQFTSPTLSPLVAARLRNNSLHWPFLCRGGAPIHLSSPKQLVCQASRTLARLNTSSEEIVWPATWMDCRDSALALHVSPGPQFIYESCPNARL